MSNAGRHRRQDVAEVIVLDSDDEGPPCRRAEAGSSSRQVANLKFSGSKRSRDGNAQPARRRSIGRSASSSIDVVDLTAAPSIPHTRIPPSASTVEDISIAVSDMSPATKRRNIAVTKAFEAHRQQGQQAYAKAVKHQAPEPREVETKPKCGICLEEMKEPACGSCGHVFCKPCLMDCLKATKKCPTCRKAMQPRTVHRIYLS